MESLPSSRDLMKVCERLTKGDGFQVDGIYKVAEQRPLEAQHVPTEDLIAAAHGAQPLPVLNSIPGGYYGARLHWDGSFTWKEQQRSQPSPLCSCSVP